MDWDKDFNVNWIEIKIEGCEKIWQE